MTLTGLARLHREPFAELRGKRIGLVAHPAAILPDCTHALAALRLSGLKVTTVFGPEHGWSGAAADGVRVTHAHDERAAVTVYSLYGDGHEPTAGMLAEVDALIFDMQDVGARFYTYASTLFYVLRAAGRAGLPVWVLDRPNPINGVSVEGPLVAPGHESFVGIAPIPIRHGLTLGELARFFNAHFALETDLTVVALDQWRRAQWFDETGLPWAPTSPNVPHLSTAVVYPGMCLLEGTNLSVGRGTALPFEICGAPWVDGEALTEALHARELPGVRFRPTRFAPTTDRFAGQLCDGVQVHVTDRAALRPVRLGLHVIAAVLALHPGRVAWNAHFDRLLGGPDARLALEAGRSAETIEASWAEAETAFADARAEYLLYH